jgi:hypothetical protein
MKAPQRYVTGYVHYLSSFYSYCLYRLSNPSGLLLLLLGPVSINAPVCTAAFKAYCATLNTIFSPDSTVGRGPLLWTRPAC